MNSVLFVAHDSRLLHSSPAALRLRGIPPLIISLTLPLFVLSCDQRSAPSGISFTDYTEIVPGPGLPPEVEVDRSNNNLDIVHHDGSLFFAFRTGPVHFASDKTRLYVLRRKGESWAYEATFDHQKDLREPRFLSLNGELFLYFAELGSNPAAFEPGKMFVSRRNASGEWSEEVQIHEPGFIPWRTKTIDGVPYMLGYLGGENEYNLTGDPITIQFLTTIDGFTWTGVNGRPYVSKGGGSETDFAFDLDGNLYAVERNEPGDETGWGSKICWAPKEDISNWECKHDPRKFDSPLMFSHKGEIYLIARRNPTETGHYDLGLRDLSLADQTARYLAAYSGTPKRCSLWQYIRNTREIEFIFDFPSKGDTCFPGMVQLSSDEYLVYNYTSPVDGKDITWIEGQLGHTLIYSVRLIFGN